MTIEITDHAIVRYLERVRGIDMDEVRREMTPDLRAIKAVRDFGKVKIKRRNFKLVMHGNKVITVTVKQNGKRIGNIPGQDPGTD